MEYATINELKGFLGISLSDSKRDEELTTMITTLTSLIDLELGRNLGLKTYTRRMSGMGTSRLIMEGPVVEVLYVRQYQGYSNQYTEVTVEHKEGSILYLNKELPKGAANVGVSYTRGYESVPPAIKQFFLKYCKDMIASFKQSDPDIKSKKIEGLQITYFSPSEMQSQGLAKAAAPKEFDSILANYKNFNSIAY